MQRVVMPYVPDRCSCFASAGSRREATRRRPGGGWRWRSAGFYASAAKKLTGPLFDQSGIVADFADEATQDHAYEAIHRFLDKSRDHATG